VLHGHGVRSRQLRGPLGAEGGPETVEVEVRRYRCCACGAVLTVVPRELQPRRHYSRPAIALALARYGLLGEPAHRVRGRLSPWQVVGRVAAGWRQLGRWIRAAARGQLLARRPLQGSARQVASRVATYVLAHAPPETRCGSSLVQVFAGAAAMT